jgi:hypothetical protein
MSKARALGDFISTGGSLSDGIIESTEINGVTATSSEINVLAGITATTTELNNVAGINSSVQTQLDSKQAIVSGVSDTEIGYLDGVTSSVQTQINSKQAIVSGVSDTEIGYLNGVTSSVQTQINSKQAIVSGVSNTEIGYLDGVTSGVQTQLDAKASSTALTTAINGLGTASALDVGTGANQVVQLNGSGQLPALSATNLTGIDGVSAAALLKYGAL